MIGDSLPNTIWAMITLPIPSPVETVGFLSTITIELAALEIPVNSLSAYYYDDHIFDICTNDRREDAMEFLQCMMRLINDVLMMRYIISVLESEENSCHFSHDYQLALGARLRKE